MAIDLLISKVCPNCLWNNYDGVNCVDCWYFEETPEHFNLAISLVSSFDVKNQLINSALTVNDILSLNNWLTYCSCWVPMKRDKRWKAYCNKCRN